MVSQRADDRLMPLHHGRVYSVACAVLTATLGVVSLTPTSLLGQQAATETPTLSLRARPRVGFAPVDVLFIGELTGGADDHAELYCATVEWDWDDDTRSEAVPDCDPYEPGVSEIRRRFSTRHTFNNGGVYEVRLNLKRRDKIVASARTRVEIRGSSRRF